MAYYKNVPDKHAPKRNYANEGSWDDEGTHYRDRDASRGEDRGSRRFGPDSRRDDATRGAHHPNRTGEHHPQGGPRPQEERRYGRPDGRRFEDRRPYGERDERRPYGDRNEHRPYGERGDRRPPMPHEDRRPPMPREDRPAPSYRDHEFRPAPAPMLPPPVEEQLPPENLLAGRNPIREALKSGRDIEKLLVQRGELSGSAREIVQLARELHVPVQEVDKVRLDELAPHHQGMLAYASAYAYSTVEAMLENAAARNEAPFLILLDGVTDPHNLGAIIRSAECAGAHGVIVPERRSVGLTPAAVKASAGAVEHLPVARVTNLNRTIEDLKKQGIWTYAVTMDGTDYEQVDFKGGVALVIGSEGEGISRLTLENCDQKVSLPLMGELDSLNASVAAGIMMYRVLSVRRK